MDRMSKLIRHGHLSITGKTDGIRSVDCLNAPLRAINAVEASSRAVASSGTTASSRTTASRTTASRTSSGNRRWTDLCRDPVVERSSQLLPLQLGPQSCVSAARWCSSLPFGY